MNMETLLNTILNNMNFGAKTETPVLGSLNIGDNIVSGLNLQIGQKMTLVMDDNLQLQLSFENGETLLLPQAEMTLEKTGLIKTPVTIEAKVSQLQNNQVQIQVQKVNNQSPLQYIRQFTPQNELSSPLSPIDMKDISGLSGIQLPNLSIVETAAPYIAELPISQQNKSDLQAVFRQIEIKVEMPNADEMISQQKQQLSPNLMLQQEEIPVASQVETKIAEVLKEVPQMLEEVSPKDYPVLIDKVANNLAEKLQEIVGQKLPAEPIQINQNIVLNTPLGDIRPSTPLQIPEQIKIELTISGIIFSENSKPETVPSFSEKVEQILRHIKSSDAQLFTKIMKHFPSDNDQMLQQITTFVKAAGKGDVRQWLGESIVKQLNTQGEQGKEILNELQNVLHQSNKQTVQWRIIEIPYYAENHIDTIRLAIKQYPEDKETQEDQRQKFGTRFVVDTNFSHLGAFQFDGFSLAKDRRFDLVVRTERSIGNDLCSNIMRLFKATLNEVDYIGNIKINLKENFIKISENNDEDKFLPQDLFI